MIIECCMCNTELAIEDVYLSRDKLLVRVWSCERCHEEIAEIVEKEIAE